VRGPEANLFARRWRDTRRRRRAGTEGKVLRRPMVNRNREYMLFFSNKPKVALSYATEKLRCSRDCLCRQSLGVNRTALS
jgi:hypothetical protein